MPWKEPTAGNISDKWISVKERVPQDEEEVLAAAIQNKAQGHAYYLATYQRKEFLSFERNTPVKGYKVTHWMPLPHPPCTLNVF